MPNGASKPRKITIYVEKNKDYKLVPVTGAHGGPTPSGDILTEFFVERRTSPDIITLEIGDDKPREVKREGGKIVREILVGILLRPDVAHSIGKWLIEKASQAGFTEIQK